MYVQYGNYRHANNEASLSPIGRNALINDAGIMYGFRYQWRLQGFLQADSFADMTIAIQALEAAYSIQGQNLGVFDNNGNATAHGILDGQTLGGIRIVSGPNYPVGDGAEYSSTSVFRRYEITLEYDIRDLRVGLLAWTESVAFMGGGPRIVFHETINTLPQKQVSKLATTYRAVQSGMAVGQSSYPVPLPIWPLDQEMAPQIVPVAPKRHGSGFSEYQISWTYYFAAVLPLVGVPTPWPNI